MEIVNRKSVHTALKEYCIFSMSDKRADDFIEVTRWTNGEGFDVHINSGVERTDFKITDGQLDALNYLVNVLNNSK